MLNQLKFIKSSFVEFVIVFRLLLVSHLLRDLLLGLLNSFLEDQCVLLDNRVFCQLLIDASLNPLKILDVILSYDCNRKTFLSHASCSANPVDVILGRWHIIIDDELDVVDVDSTRRHIC